MTRKYSFIVDGTLPGLNEYIAKTNVNKFRGNKFKQETEDIITVFIKKQLNGVNIKEPVTVDFAWFEPDKKRDKDNIAFAKKFIFDALVKSKVLANDGWACVDGFSDRFYVDANSPRVVVTLIPLTI